MEAKPTDGDQWLVESIGRGAGAFVGRITATGSRAFYFRYTGPDGKQVRLKIADYDANESRGRMSVRTARTLAYKWSALYQGDTKGGMAPIRDLRGYFAQQENDRLEAERLKRALAEKEQREAEQAQQQAELVKQRRLTVRQLFDRWVSVDLKPRVGTDGKRQGRKDGGEYTRQQFERHVFPHIGDTAAVDVRKGDVMAILDGQKASGKLRTANVLLTELKQMFRFALNREIVDRNPLDGVEKSAVGGKETERDRVLVPGEIRALARALPNAGMNRRSETAVWLILATACRVGELMNARWEHVDLQTGKWLIPAEHSKNQRHHNVHLSKFAITHFQTLADLKERDTEGQLVPWVFPNRAGKGPVCIKSFGKQLADRQRANDDERLSRRSKNTGILTLPGGHWTAHDLRRTAATLMAGLGISSDVIDECLNHMIQGRVTRVYIRDRREADQARAFESLGDCLGAIVTNQPMATNVIELRAAA